MCVLDAARLRFVTCGAVCCGPPHRRLPEHGGPDAWRRSAHPPRHANRRAPGVWRVRRRDVQYLRSGGARAAAVLAAGAAFARVLAERTVAVPRVPPCRPGQACLRELPPLRAVPTDLSGLGLPVVGGYAGLDPGGRPGLGAHAYVASGIAVTGVARSRSGTAAHAVPAGRGTSVRPLVRHGGRDASRRTWPGAGPPAPAARYAAPRRHSRPGRPARSQHDRPPARTDLHRHTERGRRVRPSAR